MRDFAYSKAASTGEAVHLMSNLESAKYLGGGTNLVDLMRENIERPDRLVDVTRLPLGQIEEDSSGGITIGASAKNSAIAANSMIRERFPVLSEAILCGASGQIRNMATVGGNLMQRTRCCYFYDQASRCNKRSPGAGCDAMEGFNRMHAILGASPGCIATHPSDMCVALAALGATVQIEGKSGKRSVPFTEFHRLPGDTPHLETELQPGELITSVSIAKLDAARHSRYEKVRDRSSYAFALVSVAAVLETENGAITTARLALGGVAHKPWRAFAAEEMLQGSQANDDTFRRAAEETLREARGLKFNSFKIELAKRMIVSTFAGLAEKEGTR